MSNNLPKIIELAREGGYRSSNLIGTHIGYFEGVLLDPEFYKALGKKLGWGYNHAWCFLRKKPKHIPTNDKLSKDLHLNPDWLYHWHNLIDLIAENGYENGVEIWAKEIISN